MLLLSARPTVTPSFAAWWTEAQWVWTVCLRLLPDSVATAIWTQALPESSTLTTWLPSHPIYYIWRVFEVSWAIYIVLEMLQKAWNDSAEVEWVILSSRDACLCVWLLSASLAMCLWVSNCLIITTSSTARLHLAIKNLRHKNSIRLNDILSNNELMKISKKKKVSEITNTGALGHSSKAADDY